MPQGRKKVPFSGKAKKEQLKAKKHSKSKTYSGQKVLIVHSSDDDEQETTVKKINEQPSRSKRHKSNRFALKFFNETNEDILRKKEDACKEIIPVSVKELEINSDSFFDLKVDFPKRPDWSYGSKREELEARENRYFTEYINNIEKNCDVKELSYFELNLETWRQLWRVLEMSDIVLLIVDIRYPAAMFPPSLYEYVTNTLHKDMILVMNKVDLAPAAVVVAWKHYFTTKYPKLNVTLFTTTPGYNLRSHENINNSGLKIRRRKGKQKMAIEGTQLLLDACKNIVGSEVDLTSWEEKVNEETKMEASDDTSVEIGELFTDKSDTGYFKHEKYKNGVLTIGCLGQPNVGKSSVMNAIMGRKVVSVSRTPGHTKHFQTIFLTPNVRLCDCPGLVFPSKVPKALQVLMGSYPIAQLRDPYTAIRFIAERLNLPSLLRLPACSDGWSPMDVCDAWAQRRGFYTAKAARPDTYRAANSLLRMCLDGKVCLCLRPVGYHEREEEWNLHPDVKVVKWVQALSPEEEALVDAVQGQSCRVVDASDDDDSEDSESERVSEKPPSGSSPDDSDVQSGALANKFMLLASSNE